MDEFSEAAKLGWEAIARMQSSGKLPAWLLLNATRYGTECGPGLWELACCIFKKRKLEPGESWERRPDGSKILVQIDPVSGKKGYVIHDDRGLGDDRVDLFRVRFELESKQATLIEAVPVADLDPESFELDQKVWPLESVKTESARKWLEEFFEFGNLSPTH